MAKVLLDTNVLVSGLASFKHPNRVPARLLHSWRAGLFELCISEYILVELKRTLNKSYFKNKLTRKDVEDVIILLSEQCTLIAVVNPKRGIATHPEDDLVISAAVSGKVDYLVTGDKHFFKKVGSTYKKVKIVTPAQFLEILS